MCLSLCFSLAIFICLLPFNIKVENYQKYWIACIYGPTACVYFILESLAYYQILKRTKEIRDKSRKLKEHIKKHQPSRNKKQIQVYLPSFIMLTFILFNIFPMLLMVLYYFIFPDAQWLFNLLAVLFSLGWMIDPLIYIFSVKSIKRKIQHSFETRKKAVSVDTVSTQSGEFKKTEERVVTSHVMQNGTKIETVTRKCSMRKIFFKLRGKRMYWNPTNFEKP